MPRKAREIRSALESKGFDVEEGRKHIHFIYVDLQGRTTAARTMLSHGAAGGDVSDNLLSQMARQIGLRRNDFLRLVDCPMSRADLDRSVALREDDPDRR